MRGRGLPARVARKMLRIPWAEGRRAKGNPPASGIPESLEEATVWLPIDAHGAADYFCALAADGVYGPEAT